MIFFFYIIIEIKYYKKRQTNDMLLDFQSGNIKKYVSIDIQDCKIYSRELATK